jgi:hydrogenase small subunit
VYGSVIRSLRAVTTKTLDKEPRWRKRGRELATGARRTW